MKEQYRMKAKIKKREARRKWREEGIATQKWIQTKPPRKCPHCGITLARMKRSKWVGHLREEHGVIIEDQRRSNVKKWVCPYKNCSMAYRDVAPLRTHMIDEHRDMDRKLCEEGYVEAKKNEGGHWLFRCKICEKETEGLNLNPEEVRNEWLNSIEEMMIHYFLSHSSIYDKLKSELDPEIELGNDVRKLLKMKTLNTVINCVYCGTEFDSDREMREHVTKAHHDECWTCPVEGCTEVILSPEELEAHFWKDHGEGTTTAAAITTKSKDAVAVKPSIEDIKGHGSSSQSEPSKNHPFVKKKRKRNLEPVEDSSLKQTLDQSTSFKCPRCVELFETLVEVNRHVEQHHPNHFFPCSFAPCPTVKFSKRSRLYHEMKICSFKRRTRVEIGNEECVGVVSIPCEFCGKSMNPVSVRLHMKTKHGIEEDPEWPCEICGKQQRVPYKSRLGWMSHMEEWHMCTDKEWEELKLMAGKVHKRGFDRNAYKVQMRKSVKSKTHSGRERIRTKNDRKKVSPKNVISPVAKQTQPTQESESSEVDEGTFELAVIKNEVENNYPLVESELDESAGAGVNQNVCMDKVEGSSLPRRRSTRARKIKKYTDYQEFSDTD